MVDAQTWLNDKYPTKKSKEGVTSLSHLGSIEAERLEGLLEIKDFPKLQEISLPWNDITSLKISNCPFLRTINFQANKLTKVELEGKFNFVKEINLMENDLTDISFLNGKSVFLQRVEELLLSDNKIVAQNLDVFKFNFIFGAPVKELRIGCSKEGVRKGKRNNFFGSLAFFYQAGNFSKNLKLDISGTDIDSGLEKFLSGWNEVDLTCEVRRSGDKVKTIADELAPLKSSSSDIITLSKDIYQNLKKSQQEQQQEAKKWEPVKDAFTNILNKLNSSDVWGVVKLYDQALVVNYPSEDSPDEINKLFGDIFHKVHSTIQDFFTNSKIKKEDITDQQLTILEKEIIPFEERVNERYQKNNSITEEEYQDNKKFFAAARQTIQKERNQRANPTPNSPNGNDPDPLFGNNPINLPTNNNAPPPSSPQQDKPDKNSPNKDIPPKNNNDDQNNKQQNDDKINQSKDIEEAQGNAEQIITELLQKSKVKPSELDKSLWKNKSDWKDYLKTLTDKQTIANFVENFRKSIEAKNNTGNYHNQSPKGGGSNMLPIFLLIGFAFLVGGTMIIVVRNKRKRK